MGANDLRREIADSCVGDRTKWAGGGGGRSSCHGETQHGDLGRREGLGRSLVPIRILVLVLILIQLFWVLHNPTDTGRVASRVTDGSASAERRGAVPSLNSRLALRPCA